MNDSIERSAQWFAREGTVINLSELARAALSEQTEREKMLRAAAQYLLSAADRSVNGAEEAMISERVLWRKKLRLELDKACSEMRALLNLPESTTYVRCPPPCTTGERCTEEVLCTPETCPYGQKGWEHTAHCIKHICAHDFHSGPVIELPDGMTTSCQCGMTAYSHDMRYAP